MESSKNNLQTEDQIDIIALLSKVWYHKKSILKTVVIFGVIGIIVALSTPNKYTASSLFTPNYSGQSGGSSGLKGLASLAGINVGSMEGTKEVSPMLYGKITEGVTFKKALLTAPIENIEGVQTLKDYFVQKESESSFLGTLKGYTIGLPGKVIGWFKSDATETRLKVVQGIEAISER